MDSVLSWDTRLKADLWASLPLYCAAGLAMYFVAHVLSMRAYEKLWHAGILKRRLLLGLRDNSLEGQALRAQTRLDLVPYGLYGLLVSWLARAGFLVLFSSDQVVYMTIAGLASGLLAMAVVFFTIGSHWIPSLFYWNYTEQLLKRLFRYNNYYRLAETDQGTLWLDLISSAADGTLEQPFPEDLLPQAGPLDGTVEANSLVVRAWKLSLDDARRVTRASGGHFPHVIFVRELMANIDSTAKPIDVINQRKKLVQVLTERLT